MKKILVKNENNEVIDESGILASQEEVDFFISQRPQFICEVVDATEEVSAIKAKESKKKAAKEAMKNLDIEGATTVAKLKAIVKALIEAQE
jgi:hypothetical protein